MSYFGLTPADVRIASWHYDGTSKPSWDEVEQYILEAEDEIRALMDAKGITYAVPSSDAVKAPAYRQARSYTRQKTRSACALHNGHIDLSDKFEEAADKIYKRMERNAVTAVASDADTYQDAADLPYYAPDPTVDPRTIVDDSTTPVTLGRRMTSYREI